MLGRFVMLFTLMVIAVCATSCGQSGGESPAPPAVVAPTTVVINGTTFTRATSADFSVTAVGALLDTAFSYKLYGTVTTTNRIYETVTGTTVGGVTITGWWDDAGGVFAVDVAGAIRKIGTGVKSSGQVTVSLFDATSPSLILPYFLPGGTLVTNQVFSPEPGSAGITAKITLNQISREGASGCLKILIQTATIDPGTGTVTSTYKEIWIKPGLGALWHETYQLQTSPTSFPVSGFIYQTPSA